MRLASNSQDARRIAIFSAQSARWNRFLEERLGVEVGVEPLHAASSADNDPNDFAFHGTAVAGAIYGLYTSMVYMIESQLRYVVGALLSESRCLSALVDELAPGNPGVLIVIDQLEELFTQCRGESERQAFINSLLALVDPAEGQPVSVLLLMRADFYASLAQYDALRALVAAQQEILGVSAAEL